MSFIAAYLTFFQAKNFIFTRITQNAKRRGGATTVTPKSGPKKRFASKSPLKLAPKWL